MHVRAYSQLVNVDAIRDDTVIALLNLLRASQKGEASHAKMHT